VQTCLTQATIVSESEKFEATSSKQLVTAVEDCEYKLPDVALL